jgi:hypothetical protein
MALPAQPPHAPTPQKNSRRLEDRGLYEAAISQGWKRNQFGNWSFPIYDLNGVRYLQPAYYNVQETMTSAAGETVSLPKTSLPAGCNLRYYVLPGFPAAVARATGTAILASGVTDMLSCHAAGMENAFSLLTGENSFPADFADTLRNWGITRLVYLMDRDTAGRTAAQQLVNRLAKTPIRVVVKDLPGGGKDANDLWRMFTSMGAAAGAIFQTAINAAQELEFVPEVVTEKRKPTLVANPDESSIGQAVNYLLVNQKGKLGNSPTGQKVSCRCVYPHNHKQGDKHRSAALLLNDQGSGIPVYTCKTCGSIPFAEFCRVVGIEHRWNNVDDIVSPTFAENTAAATNLLEDIALCQAMNAAGDAPHARFLALIYMAGANPGDEVLIKDLTHRVNVASGMIDAEPLFKSRRITDLVKRTYCNESALGVTETFFLFVTKRKVHISAISRPAQLFVVPSVERLRELYGVTETIKGDPLPVSALYSDKVFKQATHAAYIAAQQNRWSETGTYESTNQLAGRLGVKRRTIWKYEKEMGTVKKSRRWKDQPVADDYELTPAEKAQGCVLGLVNGLWVKRIPLASARRLEVQDTVNTLLDFAVGELGAVIHE